MLILKSCEVIHQAADTHPIVFWGIMPGDFFFGEEWKFIVVHHRGLRHVGCSRLLSDKEGLVVRGLYSKVFVAGRSKNRRAADVSVTEGTL
jgi:hypothetical protein